MVRGTCPLPHGSGKTVRVLVFATGPAADAARDAGAEFVGYEDMMKKVTGGFLGFRCRRRDARAPCPKSKKLGKILGPRGLMPNPEGRNGHRRYRQGGQGSQGGTGGVQARQEREHRRAGRKIFIC